MRSLSQTTTVVDTIVKALLSNTNLIVPIAETVGKVVSRAIDEYSPREIEETSTTVPGQEPWVEGDQPLSTKPSKKLSDSESHVEPRRSRCSLQSSNQYRKGVIKYPTPSLTGFLIMGTTAVIIL